MTMNDLLEHKMRVAQIYREYKYNIDNNICINVVANDTANKILKLNSVPKNDTERQMNNAHKRLCKCIHNYLTMILSSRLTTDEKKIETIAKYLV